MRRLHTCVLRSGRKGGFKTHLSPFDPTGSLGAGRVSQWRWLLCLTQHFERRTEVCNARTVKEALIECFRVPYFDWLRPGNYGLDSPLDHRRCVV